MTDTLQQLIARANELQRSRSRSNEHINQLNDAAFNIRHAAAPNLLAELSQSALRLATANDYDRGRAFALRNFGIYQFNTDQYKLALETFEHSRRIFDRLQDHTGLAAAIIGIGETQTFLGQHEQALDNLSIACQLFEKSNDKYRVAACLSGIGMASRRMGNPALAIDHFYRGLRFAEEAQAPLSQANLYNNLGHVFLRLDAADEAIEHLHQALPITRSQQSRLGQSIVTLNLGAAHLARQQYADALLYLEHGLSLARAVGYRQGEGEAQLRLGQLQRAKGDLSAAASSMRQALQMAQAILDRSNEAEVMVELGLLLKHTGELSEARELLGQAAALSAEFGYKEELYKAQLGLSQVCEAAGEASAALRHHQAFFRVWSEVHGSGPSLQLGRVLQQHNRLKQTFSERESRTIGLTPRKLQQVIEHIAHHIDGSLSTAELASVAGLGEKHFQQMFKQSTGKTPHQFVIEQRVKYARQLIETSQLPLAEVAARCGFSSQAHLSTQFRAVQGTTPSKIRRQTST